MFDYFISRAGPDREIALQVARVAREIGKTVIIQDEDFLNGSNFVALIHKGLSRSRQIIALLSREYMKRDFCLLEISDAIYRDPLGLENRLILFRLDDCPLEGVLSARVYDNLATAGDPDERGMRIRSRLLATGESAFCLTPFLGLPAPPDPLHGRAAELAVLAERFEAVSFSGCNQVIAIHGQPGAGKRSLVAHFARQLRDRIGGAVLCEAPSPSDAQRNLSRHFAALSGGRKMAAGGGGASGSAVKRRIANGEAPWLMIFRNPPTPETLDALVPERWVMVIALCDTGARPGPTHWPEDIWLPGLLPDEAAAFLDLHATKLQSETRLRAATVLRGIPGALLKFVAITSSEAVDANHMLDTLESTMEDTTVASVDALTDAVLSDLSDLGQSVNDLLWKFAVLGEAEIPELLLHILAGPSAAHGLDAIRKLHILEAPGPDGETGSAQISPLFHQRLRSCFLRLDTETQSLILKAVCSALVDMIGQEATRGSTAGRHVAAVLEMVAERGGPLGPGWDLARAALARGIVPPGERDRLLSFLVRAASNIGSVTKTDCPAVLSALGHGLSDANMFEVATQAFDAAADAARLAGRRPDAARALIDAARAAAAGPDREEGLRRLTEAVALAQHEDRALLADALEALAHALRHLDGPSEAVRDALLEALSYRTALYGAADPRAARLLRDLGSWYRDQGKYADAARCLVESAGALVPHLDAYPRDLAAAEGDLALVYLDWGDVPKADIMSRRAYLTALDRLGEDDPLTQDLGALRVEVLKAKGLTMEADHLRGRLAGASRTLRNG